jgi:hypothetical protein
VQGTIVLDISIQQWNETAFKENLARALGIPIFRINVVSVKGTLPFSCYFLMITPFKKTAF